jgi:tetratricopeptide (TPR) repeat protein
VQAAPAEFEPRFRLALTHYLLRNYAAVVEVMKPGEGMLVNPEAISLTASAEAKLGHVETATSELQASITGNPQSPHAYINLALIELDQGNNAAAEVTLARFRALKIESSAKVFYGANRDFCSDIVKAIGEGGLEPSSHDKGEFYYQLALQLQERFNFLSAVQLLRLAQANEGNSARVLLAAGTSCLNHDPQAAEPVVLLQEAIRRDAGLDNAYYLLGRAYVRAGKPMEAIAAYRKAVELRPNAPYCLSLGKALKNRQDAIAEFKQALVIDPSYAPAYLELGRTYVQLEEFDKARPHLEKAIELEPDYYEAYYLLGRLFHRLGDEEQSRRLLKQFTDKKSALMQQSVIDAGYIGDGH